MRWLLDQGLPRSTASFLRQASHDAVHVGEIGLAAAADDTILDRAASEHRVVVTMDADFHALLAVRRTTGPSVVRIREEGLRAPEIADLLDRLARTFPTRLENGCLMTFSNGKVRYRDLPLS